MQVTVETTQGLERKMRVVVPSERVENQITEKVKETARRARINGFRPGKVPLREVKRRFGQGIRQEVSAEIIKDSYDEALKKEEISPAGRPQIEEVKTEEGQDLEYTAVFEVFPEFEVADFGGISVEKVTSEIQESDIEEMIESLRNQRVSYEPIQRAIQEKDKVNLDFETLVDGEVVADEKDKDVIPGPDSTGYGFEDRLAGLEAGDEKDLEVTLPESYRPDDLAGKAVVIKVKINSVSEPVLPELNDEFFAFFGITEGGGMEAFRKELVNNMQRELDSAVKAKVKDQVMKGLLETNDVEIPQALIDMEINLMRGRMVRQFTGPAGDVSHLLPDDLFSGEAQRQVKLGLLVSRIVEQHEVQPDAGKVREMIETIASQYEHPEEIINAYYSEEQRLNEIRNLVLQDQVVDLVLENASVTEKAVGYQEAVRPEVPVSEDEASEGDSGGSPHP